MIEGFFFVLDFINVLHFSPSILAICFFLLVL